MHSTTLDRSFITPGRWQRANISTSTSPISTVPFSQYFNATMFAIFGVSLRTLIFVNLAIVLGVVALIYRLLTQLSDSLTATCACVVFVLLFAFSQYVGIGNYNWICPYTHEVTHGVALSLAMIAAIDAMLRTNHRRWGVISGALLGLVFLTKAEVFAPAAGAAAIVLILRRATPSPGIPGEGRGEGDFERKTILDSSNHPHPNPLPEYRERGTDCVAPLLISSTGVIAITFTVLSITLNPTIAIRAIAGSWPWGVRSPNRTITILSARPLASTIYPEIFGRSQSSVEHR